MTNLILLPPTIILVQLFRRSKKRKTHVTKLKELLKPFQDDQEELQKRLIFYVF